MEKRSAPASLTIEGAADEDRRWAAALMATSEPWITLGRRYDRCLQACSDPVFDLFIAKQDGRPAGFMIIHPRGVAGSPYIASIAVAPEQRGGGIGARMLAFAEEQARSRGPHIFLCVSSFNDAARRFYERNGYTHVGTLANYVIDGADELLMHKRLAPAGAGR